MRTTKIIAVLALALSGTAHATSNTSTVGNVLTVTENFDGGSGMAGYYNTGVNPDDYLKLNTGLFATPKTSSLQFSTEAPSSAIINFYYAFFGSSPASVTLDGTSYYFSATGDVAAVNDINPGPEDAGLIGTADKFYQSPAQLIGSGLHTLIFSTGSGTTRSLKVDDIIINATSVPEPATYALLLAGLGLIGGIAHRRK